jgi:hypothetical protein
MSNNQIKNNLECHLTFQLTKVEVRLLRDAVLSNGQFRFGSIVFTYLYMECLIISSNLTLRVLKNIHISIEPFT